MLLCLLAMDLVIVAGSVSALMSRPGSGSPGVGVGVRVGLKLPVSSSSGSACVCGVCGDSGCAAG